MASKESSDSEVVGKTVKNAFAILILLSTFTRPLMEFFGSILIQNWMVDKDPVTPGAGGARAICQ
jgi:hypothetical protein